MFTVSPALLDSSITLTFESIEFIINPCRGFKDGGLYIFVIVKEMLKFDWQSEVGQTLVILILVGLTKLNVADWLIPLI